MKLLRPLPAHRTFEQVQHHYLVEKALADRLRNASHDERRRLYATMYEELHRQVPDHARLSRRAGDPRPGTTHQQKLAVVRDFLTPTSVVVEFAPGDCRFALEVSRHVSVVYAIDISDQRGPDPVRRENFSLIIYDGYRLDEIPEGSVDVVFSNHFIEHLHPEDTRLHFELAYRLLKSGGRYVFRTPQALTGPHDVSKYFSEEPQGFHLKEWTYREFRTLLREINFSKVHAIRQTRTSAWHLPYLYFHVCEMTLAPLPRRYRRRLVSYLVPSVCIVAVK